MTGNSFLLFSMQGESVGPVLESGLALGLALTNRMDEMQQK